MPGPTKLCPICGTPRLPYHDSCPRCYKLIGSRDKRFRRMALIAAFSKLLDGFVCAYTGVKLEEEDTSSPWYLTFDHAIPGKPETIIVCAAIINDMKSDLSGDEFRAVVMEYDRHRKGAPFNRDVIMFQYWNRKAKPERTPLQAARHPGRYMIDACEICGGKPRKYGKYCSRCKRRWPNIPGHLRAMKNAWCKEQDGFLDYYIDIKMDEADLGNPYYMVFDHRIPGKKGDLVLTSMMMNSLKSALSEEEFNLVMNELARHFEGKPFNRDVVKFLYWKGW